MARSMRLTVYGLLVCGLTHFSATTVAMSLNIDSIWLCLSLSDTWSSPLARICPKKKKKRKKDTAGKRWGSGRGYGVKMRWEGKKHVVPVYRFLSGHPSQTLWSSHPSLPPVLWIHWRKLSWSVKPHPGLSLWKKTRAVWIQTCLFSVVSQRSFERNLTDMFNTTFTKQTS